MKKKWWFIVGGVLLVAGAAIALAVVFKNPATQTYANTEQGISLEYPKSLVSQNVSEADKKDRVILRLKREQPATLITIRYEEGFRAIAAATRQSPLDIILSTLSKRYPSQFPEYKKLEERRIKVSNRDTAEIVFTYKGTEGVTIKQRFVAVIKDDNKAFYIAAQVEESGYNSASKEFDSLINSISIN